jgi:hypothetical protein
MLCLQPLLRSTSASVWKFLFQSGLAPKLSADESIPLSCRTHPTPEPVREEPLYGK